MKLMNEALIDKARAYVKAVFKEKHDPRSTYHSYEHTREVAEAALKIGQECGLRPDDLEAVVLAAWFHDTGYLFRREDHESSSAETASLFLRKERYSEDKIRIVNECILATRLHHVPRNLLEEVIHDADYINLANTGSLRQSELLKQESVNYGGMEPTQEEWLTAELNFFLNHRYYTAYGRKDLEEKKAGNILKLKNKLRTLREDGTY